MPDDGTDLLVEIARNSDGIGRVSIDADDGHVGDREQREHRQDGDREDEDRSPLLPGSSCVCDFLDQVHG